MKRFKSIVLAITLISILFLPACGPSATPAPTLAPPPTAFIPTNTPVPTATATTIPTATVPANPNMILATTTSTQDSGLLDVLVPAFEAATGFTVKIVAVGSGAALKLGEEGNADVLLVHSPAAEKTFMTNGFGTDRRLVMHNYYIIVGPAADPAGIAAATSAVDAFQKIASSGAEFISRGDGSGTNAMELALWKKAGITPAGQGWYVETGQGMGATLTIASEKSAYTLTDRATFLSNQSNLQLGMLYENDAALLNAYHIIVVNHDKWPSTNLEGAIAFADFIVSPAGQAIINEYGKDKFGQQLFIPDAGKTDAELGLP
jgi:tungstate transport system substrate-binding protein